MFPQASFSWLLLQEARILWRGSALLRAGKHVVVPLTVVAVVFQGTALLLGRIVAHHHLTMPELILAANLNLFFFSFLMLSRAMSMAVDVLYGRGDVDFLLASPIPPGRVLAVRMLGVAFSVASPWLLLGGMLANALAVFGAVWAVAIYPVLLAVGFIAAAAAFALVVGLVRHFGPKRARNAAQLLALATGLVIFALGQAPRFIQPAIMVRLWQTFMPANDTAGLQWIPARAMLGEPIPLLGFIVFALAMFWLAWAGLGRAFATGAIQAAAYRPATAKIRETRFRATPFNALFWRDLRLLLRFPGLATQTVYRSLTLVPVLMILAGRRQIGVGPEVVAPLLVFLTGQLALFFVSVMMGSDQAPELAASAPVDTDRARHARLAAAGYGALWIMLLPVAAVAWQETRLLPVLLAGMAGVLISNLALGEKLPIPLIRAAFGKTQKGTLLGLILGVAVSSLWALLAWLAVTPHPLAAFLHPA